MNTYKRTSGFTLIELMIAVAIIGVLASIAMPAYQGYIMKGKRSDAKAALITLQLAQEKYRANNPSYGTLTQLGTGTTSPDGYYTLSASSITGTTYTLTATATGGQASDTECATLSIDQDGAKTATNTTCW